MGKLLKVMKLALTTGIAASMVLAGCSKSSSTEGKNDESSGKAEEAYEIQMLFPITGTDTGLNEVIDEVNKITKEKINATVKVKTTSLAAWNQQSNLQLVGGDKIDVIFTSANTLGLQVAKNFLLPLDDLLKEHGKGISEVMDPDYLKAAAVDGKVYALPSIRDMASSFGFVMRKDIADKYGIDPSKIKSFDDMEAALKIVKEKEPTLTPLAPASGSSHLLRYFQAINDPLGDGIGVLPKLDNNLKVVNYFETPEYQAIVERMRKWYEAGYLPKDASTNQKTPESIVKAGAAFAYANPVKPGKETKTSIDIGQPMVVAQVVTPSMTTAQVTAANFSIPRSSKNPEKTMEFLNLLYTDKDLINLFDWGIEGKHYVVRSDGLIEHPPGTDATKPPYGLNQGWMFGNQLVSHIFKGDNPDLYKQLDTFNKEAIRSKALGFTYNAEPVKTELAAINNVVTEYQTGLETGTLDPKVYLPKFIKALKDAGIDKVIQEKQKQLDEWAKKNK